SAPACRWSPASTPAPRRPPSPHADRPPERPRTRSGAGSAASLEDIVMATPAPTPQPVVTGKLIAAFVALSVGMFMAILDIQIVASSLAEIQAGLSASSSEI